MNSRSVNLTDGRFQNWTVETDRHSWQFQTVSQRLTAHHPPRLPAMPNLNINLSLSIGRGDPQWDLFTTTERPGGRVVNAVALETTLARVATALAEHGGETDWRVRAARTYSADLSATAYGIAGPGTAITVDASAGRPGSGHDVGVGNRIWDRMAAAGHSTAECDNALQWLLTAIPTLPGMPNAGTDWATQTKSFMIQPFPGAPSVGQIEVRFTNAINGRCERRLCADEDEARRVAAEHQPFNNTRVDAHRVVSVQLGIPSWEVLDLGPLNPHPAALAHTPRRQTFPPLGPAATVHEGQSPEPGVPPMPRTGRKR